jgi:4-hydroxymandelate synthase
MQFTGIDHVEFYVADLAAATSEFCGRYGFTITAATGQSMRDRHSLLLTQGSTRLVLTTGVGDGCEVNAFLDTHGEGVRTIALRVPDAAHAFATAVKGGAVPVRSPAVGGGAVAGAVEGPESMVHAFVEWRTGEALLPGFHAIEGDAPGQGTIQEIDHLAICLPRGTLAAAEEFYQRTLGLRRTFSDYVEFGEQAMESVVVEDASGRIKFTLVAPDCEDGQLTDYLSAFGGGGVQHVAFLTDRIAKAVPELTARGVVFLSTPARYYDTLRVRLGYTEAETRALAELGVLADRDPWGDLLQIFTRSPFPRRTVFFELIERRNARTFGAANIRALYEAAEHERGAQLLDTAVGER